MKHLPFRLLSALLLISTSGCISLRVKELPFPEKQVTSMLFCREINESGVLLEPVEPRSEIPQDAVHIHCFVRLEDISDEISVKWKWYSPDKQLKRETEDVVINRERVYLKAVTAYDTYFFDTDSKPGQRGKWTVAFFLNGNLAAGRSFRIKDPSTGQR